MLAALALLGGCATVPRATLAYHIEPLAGSGRYELACVQSSSGSCHVRIESAQDGDSYTAIAAGTTQTLEHAAMGASYCVSDTVPGWLMCRVQHMRFGPAGTVVTASRG